MTDEPADAVRGFVDAVAWGEHHRVWELFSAQGRRAVLEIADRRGMDADLVARLGAGTAPAGDQRAFLVDLVNGLRTDLQGTDLDLVEFEAGAATPGLAPADSDHAFVTVSEPPVAGLAALGGGSLPVATVEVVREPEGWRVLRLVPQRRP